jgi:hypothetical protein
MPMGLFATAVLIAGLQALKYLLLLVAGLLVVLIGVEAFRGAFSSDPLVLIMIGFVAAIAGLGCGRLADFLLARGRVR